MRKLLSVLLMICLFAPLALAEEFFGGDDAEYDIVDTEVGEVDFVFGDDGSTQAPEEYYIYDESADTSDDGSCYLNCPDANDVKYMIEVSDRVYPGALVWPLPGTQPLKHISSHVGWRNAARIHRNQGGTMPSWLHHGIDVSGVTTAQQVVAAADGVAYAGEQRGNGLYVVIDHGNGFYTKSQHLSRFAGEIFDGCEAVPVKACDPIGYVGSSGGDYPVHFHFEIAFSPDGAGFDDVDYQWNTHNHQIYAYSFALQDFVKMRWPDRWELCSAEYQTFVSDASELTDEETPED